MSTGRVAAMSAEDDMTSQGRGGAGGKVTGRGSETAAETNSENVTRWHRSRPSDSSTMNAAGRTVSGAKKTRNTILGPQKN